jgi:hypothetical protein
VKLSEAVGSSLATGAAAWLLSSNINCQQCGVHPDWCPDDASATDEACRTIFGFAALDPGVATVVSLLIGFGAYFVLTELFPRADVDV